jgi:hypothetical protein
MGRVTSSHQRVVLHVGLPKTGTTYLQGLLADHRDELRAAGVLYPFLGPGAMFRGAVEVRGSWAKFGLAEADVVGTWDALCARVRDFAGTTVLSHEVLAGATPEQVRRAFAPLAGLEVHVVVTARDLGRQATAHWQEEVKLGDRFSFRDLERDQLRADTGRDAGPDAGGVRPHFWHAQDFADALRRWSATIPPGRAHLVVAPPPGAPADELWRRFAAAIGVAPDVLDARRGSANVSLGAAEVAHLREVNVALGDRLDRASYTRLVKREYAEGALAARAGRPARAPTTLRDVLVPATEAWVAEVRAAGYRVHGDLADLRPVLAGPDDPHPDDVPDHERVPDDADRVAARLASAAADAPTSAAQAAPTRRLGRAMMRRFGKGSS